MEISHSTARSIFLPIDKVRDRTAPYLHETTHVVAPCDNCPMWFSEGLASHVQSYISEHAGGYDGGVFSQNGNRGINQDVRRWLASDSGQAVAPYIGVLGEPPAINYDRSNVAAPFYVMAQSFVRFIVKRASIEFALWSPRYVLSVVLEGWGIGDGGGYLPGRAGGNETT